MNDGAYVRSAYGVPARIGGRVQYEHEDRTGTIMGFEDAYVMIQLDADAEPFPFHPTWKLTYLTKP